MSTTSRRRNERGAVAVMVAILSVLLLTVGALSVDLGNAWARKRSAQKQVDVAAMAGAALLPAKSSTDRTAVAQAVADSMNRAENDVSGQQAAAFTATQLLDSNTSNGEITFQDNNGATCAVTGLCTQITVTSPLARVNFGLGRLVSDGVDVERTAVAKIFSEVPDGSHTLPFWLPNGCAYGSAEGDTSNGNGGGGGGNPIVANGLVATAPAAAAAAAPEAAATSPAVGSTAGVVQTQSAVVVSPVGNHSIAGTNYAVAVGSTTNITNYVVSNVPQNTDRATIRFISPNGQTFVDFAVNERNPAGTLIVPAFAVGPAVSGTSGVWTVYALIKPNGNHSDEYSTNHLTFTVGNPSVSTTLTTSTTTTSSPPTSTSTSGTGSTSTSTSTTTQTVTATPTGNAVGCTGQNRGNFGQLDSPRRDVNNIQQALGPNIANGLDHSIVQFLDLPLGTINCDDVPASRQAEVSEDEAPPENGRNCIQGNTGNDGPKMLEGLITGTTNPTFQGRLDVAGRPDRNTSSLCSGGRTNAQFSSGSQTVNYNNDVLSCYLRNGATLRDISQPTGVSQSMVDPSIINSPRFVWLPVVYAQTRDEHGFQPIYTFTAAFITDERYDFDNNTPVNATSNNGITIQGNSVSTLTVFTFNSQVLPTDAQSPNVAYNEQIGRPIPRLVG